MKKITLLLTSFMLMLALTACGSDSESKSDKLVVWAFGEEGNNLGEFLENEFDGEVEVVAIPWGQANEKLNSALVSGEGPDVVQLGTSWVPQFASAGVLADLSSYGDKYSSFNKDNFFDGAQELMTVDGKLVSIPWYVDTRVIYYRTDIFEELGLEVPTTWEEFYAVCEKLAGRGEGKYAIQFDANDQFTTVTYGWQNGWTPLENGKANFDDAKYVEAVEYLNSLYQSGFAIPAEKSSGTDIVQTFGNGDVPMMISGPWMVNVFNDNIEDFEDKFSIMEMPANKNSASLLGGSNLVVMNDSKNKDEAARLVDFLAQESTQVKWYQKVNALPAVTKAWDDTNISSNSYNVIFKNQLDNAIGAPVHPEWEKVAQEVVLLQQAMEIVDGFDVDSQITKLQDAVEDILE